jgi:hypothetical protein
MYPDIGNDQSEKASIDPREGIVICLQGSVQHHNLKDRSSDTIDPDHAFDENATPVADT